MTGASPIVDRLRAKVAPPNASGCRLWQAGVSRGGYREVDYGAIKVAGKVERAHRLVLMLKTAPVDVPRDPDESFADWLRRAKRWYADVEASHTCDVSLCCAEDHLEWQDHSTNVRQQAERRRRARRAA